jgi:hypothetical protein
MTKSPKDYVLLCSLGKLIRKENKQISRTINNKEKVL